MSREPYISRDTMEETIRQLRIQLDNKDEYIRKLEAGFERVEAGSWESQADLDWQDHHGRVNGVSEKDLP